MTDGLTNAVSSAIYGNGKLKSLKSTFWRGAGVGAATAGINNLSDALMPRQTKRSGSGRNGSGNRYTGGNGRSPYTRMRNPRACGAPSAFQGGLGYRNAYGYQYQAPKAHSTKREKFSLGRYAKDVLLGAVVGGLSSALFYGAGKGVEKLAGSLKRIVKGERELFLPDDYYQNVNKNIYEGYQTPNTKKIYNRLGNTSHEIETSVVISDNYGRIKYRVDYTTHGNNNAHTNPHMHEFRGNTSKGNYHISYLGIF